MKNLTKRSLRNLCSVKDPFSPTYYSTLHEHFLLNRVFHLRFSTEKIYYAQQDMERERVIASADWNSMIRQGIVTIYNPVRDHRYDLAHAERVEREARYPSFFGKVTVNLRDSRTIGHT